MLFWNAPISKASRMLDDVNGHELFFYGITIGWLGIGFVVGKKRQPTKRALDADTWICKNCDRTSSNFRVNCFWCGHPRQ